MTDTHTETALPVNALELATSFTVAVRHRTEDRDPEHAHPEITIESRGHDTWALCWAGMCFDWTDQTWDYESMPSSRTDAYIDRTRYALAEAFGIAPDAIAAAVEMQGPMGQWIESRIA